MDAGHNDQGDGRFSISSLTCLAGAGMVWGSGRSCISHSSGWRQCRTAEEHTQERQTVGGGCCMEREEVGSERLPETPLFPPFPVLLAGMGAIAAAWLLGAALAGGPPRLPPLPTRLGALAVGAPS